MLNTDCLPPSRPPQESRLDAESRPKYGCLPAPKIPPAMRGATGLASICGAGAATVTQRTSPGMGWLPVWACAPPKAQACLQRPEEACSARPASAGAALLSPRESSAPLQSAPFPCSLHPSDPLPQATHLGTSKEEAWGLGWQCSRHR